MAFNYTEIAATLYRGFISLILLFIITKMLGKKQVSQLTLFDYVIGISIGNFAAEMTINLDSAEINGIIAVIEFGLIAYLVSFLTLKSIWFRRFFTGPPTILIDNGQINYKNLQKVHYDINDLLESLRINGYFDTSIIQFALMEANGKISILPKKDHVPPTNNELNLQPKKSSLVANLIIDGKIMKKNLISMGKDENWLFNQIENIENVILATLDMNEKFTVFYKNKCENKNILD